MELHFFFVAISGAATDVCSRAQTFISLTLYLYFVWHVSDRLLSCPSPELCSTCSSVSASLSCPQHGIANRVLCHPFTLGEIKLLFFHIHDHITADCSGLAWPAHKDHQSAFLLLFKWKQRCSLIPCFKTEQHLRGSDRSCYTAGMQMRLNPSSARLEKGSVSACPEDFWAAQPPVQQMSTLF